MASNTSTDARQYTLYGPEFKADPFPTYAQMRRDEPVTFHSGLNGEYMMWFVTGYEEAETVLRDHKRFVKNWLRFLSPAEQAQQASSDIWRLLNAHMLNTDAPDHARLRTLISKAFTTRIVNNLQGRVQAIVDELLDAVADRGEMDLIDDYAFPLPIVVICDLLGIPIGDRVRFRAWTNAFISPQLSTEGFQEAQRLLTEFVGYLRETIEARRGEPQNDLITGLVQAEEAGDKLSEPELFSMIALLIVAGHETTVNLIGNGTLALLRHPEQLALLQRDPSLIENAIEEILRYDGPVERATMRFAAEDTELGGKRIRRGQPVNVVLSSANRDAEKFAEADELEITRTNVRHLAFGVGIHYCLGAPLARMEGQIAINTLLRRLPTLRLAAPVDELTWGISPIIRGMNRLPVAWDVDSTVSALQISAV